MRIYLDSYVYIISLLGENLFTSSSFRSLRGNVFWGKKNRLSLLTAHQEMFHYMSKSNSQDFSPFLDESQKRRRHGPRGQVWGMTASRMTQLSPLSFWKYESLCLQSVYVCACICVYVCVPTKKQGALESTQNHQISGCFISNKLYHYFCIMSDYKS